MSKQRGKVAEPVVRPYPTLTVHRDVELSLTRIPDTSYSYSTFSSPMYYQTATLDDIEVFASEARERLNDPKVYIREGRLIASESEVLL